MTVEKRVIKKIIKASKIVDSKKSAMSEANVKRFLAQELKISKTLRDRAKANLAAEKAQNSHLLAVCRLSSLTERQSFAQNKLRVYGGL